MQPKSAKAKGRKLQNQIRDDLNLIFGAGKFRSAIMGGRGQDVHSDTVPLSIECANVENINIWKKLEQAERNARKEQIYAVVFKKNGKIPHIALHWGVFLLLLAIVKESGRVLRDAKN